MRTFVSIVILSLALSGCSSIRNSKVNPLNWFNGETQSTQKSLIPEENMLRRRPKVVYAGIPVYFVTAAALEKTLDGKILRIDAKSDRIGAADIRIEDLPDQGDGILRVVVKAVTPLGAPVGSERAREIAAARFFSQQDLEKYKAIDVNSANNVLRVRN